MSEELNKLARAMRDMSDMVGDLHWIAAKAVEDLTRKDGEIAKRDEGLAACRVAVENCELFRARIAELEAENENLAAAVRVSQQTAVAVSKELRAELAAIKAQGVVMPEREEFEDAYSAEYGTPVSVLKLLREGENYIEKPQHSDRLNSSWWMWQKACARLNAAHAQQVSVPDDEAVMAKARELFGWAYDLGGFPDAVRDLVAFAHPAAPAADAGLVEALEKLARLGNGDKYGNSDGNLIAQAALAAHRAKGVV